MSMTSPAQTIQQALSNALRDGGLTPTGYEMLIRYFGIADGERATLEEIAEENGWTLEKAREFLQKTLNGLTGSA